MPAKGRLALGYIHGNDMSSWFHHSVNALFHDDWRRAQRFKGREIACLTPAGQLDTGRNAIARQFLDHSDSPEWLLMVDTDMAFTPADVWKLIEAADADERPVVGGLCFAGSAAGVWPTLLRLTGDGFERVLDYPRDSIVRVDATGAAFLLIHRRIFQELEKISPPEEAQCPFFAVQYAPDNQFTEDTTFCLRLRRIEAPLHVHTGVRINHLKPVAINEDFYNQFRATMPPPA